MLERRHKIPSASDLEREQISYREVSLLLLKPEISLLEPEEKDRLTQVLESHFINCGEPLCVFPVLLDKEVARKLWQRDVGHYPWAENYYEHMSSAPCVAIILSGRSSAHDLKRAIRSEMSQSISKISGILRYGFVPDIVHGSDPDDGLVELRTLIEVVDKKQ